MASSHRYTSTVECYDCRQSVRDLKSHRKVCVNRKGPSGDWTTRSSGSIDASSSSASFGGASNKHSKQPVPNTKDVFVLLDVSGSMVGARLTMAKGWIRQIESSLLEKDRFSLITFDTQAFLKLHLKPTGKLRRLNELESTLDQIYARNMTACYDAMCLALEQVLASDTRETHLIVISDGEDNSSRAGARDEIQKHIDEKPNICVHFIQIDSDLQAHRDLVEATNGLYLPVLASAIGTDSGNQLPESLQTILATTTTKE